MQIRQFQDASQLTLDQDCVLVLGYFDGLHRGHKALFDKAKEVAEKKGLPIVVMTFNESPKLTFARFSPELLLHISHPEKRYQKFEEYGVDYLFLTDFTSSFSKISSDDFIRDYICQLRAQTVIVGFDYKFGHNRTNSDYLARNFSGQVITMEEVQENGQKISSTRIRELISKGDVAEANTLLGYEFSTRGIVVHGDARGRTIGFPTANLAPIDRTFLPSDGVYVADVIVGGKRYRSMTSVGKNVTFGGTELRLEANIFDFSGDIYGQSIEIIWLEKIRDMVKFNGIDDLVDQLHQDKAAALNWGKSEK
ncbi:bifunctional riboflavin kinase/FAD synthetase [Streptococcus loxodontisalivarius]|uniref:Riboflavin biosynthesis protein n=1 Tax=Streptococcus loxodontisalivarius TaxID=1349415 RepID=A0ABS2PP78_9STRE|nr:bifunctional riboflavin kinase/FAD synthetase [Streptococcus loxodontisalivarius]MBM7641838.1 riboflavin kinase/FMN adenylyltransferase [Streptococcus loxodontisalivarius]